MGKGLFWHTQRKQLISKQKLQHTYMKESKHFLYSLKTEILSNLIANLKNVYLPKKIVLFTPKQGSLKLFYI